MTWTDVFVRTGKQMQQFEDYLHERIVDSSCKRWYHHIDLEHSNYVMEFAQFQEVVLTGHPCTKPENCRIDVNFHYCIGNSHQVHCIHIKASGYKEAAAILFSFPQFHHICKECGGVVEKSKACSSCLFHRLYAEQHGKKEVCTICQESVYRTRLPCGHHFHLTCLLQLNRIGMSCPNCRMRIPTSMVDAWFGSSDDEDESEDEHDMTTTLEED